MRLPKAALLRKTAAVATSATAAATSATAAASDSASAESLAEVEDLAPLGAGSDAPLTAKSVEAHSPLDGAVDALLAHGEHVTHSHIDKLTRLFAAHGLDVRRLDEDLDQPIDLREEIRKQFRLLRQVQSSVVGSSDVEQIKKVLSVSREIFQSLMKFQDAVHLQERSQAFENAVVETLKEAANPELMKKFRFILAQKLSKTSKAAA